MELRIGIENSPQTLEVDLPDDSKVKTVTKELEAALSGESKLLWLEDKDGNSFGIASEKITFVRLGSGSESRSIGFGV